jgi:hypothetical protein
MPKQHAYNPLYALNAICPYFTMFPLEYPFKVLKRFRRTNPVVFDPFCGRGTTIYAAREMGLSSWGIDSSPIAVAIAKAKLASASLEEVLSLAETLILTTDSNTPETEFFNFAYSNSTLKQLCSLREGLMKLPVETDASVLLRAATLGCLHGPLSKTTVGAAYFSNQMPRTFSTKPDYSVKYWKKNNLIPPNIGVIDVLRRKLSRIKGLGNLEVGNHRQIILSDSRLTTSYKNISEDISLVITSPPYYGMRTYIQDHWLRMWFLGGPSNVDYSNDTQIDHNGKENFIKSLSQVWKNISSSKADDLHLFIRLGSLNSARSNPKEILRSSIENVGGLKLVSVRNANDAHAGKRQADQMVSGTQAAQEFDFHVVRT